MGIDLNRPDPLYKQVADDIRAKINAGEIPVGSSLGSHNLIAGDYNISVITVRKALSLLVQEGLVVSRVGKGTFVQRRTAQAARSVPRCLGLVLSDLNNPFFSLITHAAEDAAYQRGYNVLLSNSSGQADKEEAQINNFRQIGADGLVIASMRRVHRITPSLEELMRDGFPFVMVSYIREDTVSYVGSDHELGGYLAGRHLLSLGYRKLGYVSAEQGNILGDVRRRGYLRALHEAGVPHDPELVFHLRRRPGVLDFHCGYEIGKQFRHLSKRPEALFFYNDVSALGFEKAVLEEGLTVPGDVAIVGFDGIERGEFAEVPLTTVCQPTMDIGRRAVDALVEIIEGRQQIVRVTLPPTLLIRESCGHRLHETTPPPIVRSAV